MSNLVPGVGPGRLLQSELIANDRCISIGAVHRLDFREAIVLTHDRWKQQAGGIPQHSFLLATAFNPDTTGGDDDDEVLLLRVEGIAPLSLEADLHAVREEALRTALSQETGATPSNVLDVQLDPFTKNRVQFTGLRCRILGTFYEDQHDGRRELCFGADVDNFYATSAYRVLKPFGAGLSAIASFQQTDAADRQLVRIGSVRYAATRRRATAFAQADAAVRVNLDDFIGHKTALLGMTRTGKSNTAKILIARTFIASEERRAAGGSPIGQLIFDPQGEYANANTQDGTHIAAIGADHVRIFQFGADGSQPHVLPLGINFYDPEQIDTVQGLIADHLRREGQSGYVRDFAQVTFTGAPDDRSAQSRAMRARALLYGALQKAAYPLPAGWSVTVPVNAKLRPDLESEMGSELIQAGQRAGIYRLDEENLRTYLDAVLKLRDDGNDEAKTVCEDSRWQHTEPIYTGRATGAGNVRGYRNLNELRIFHNPATNVDIAEEVYSLSCQGKIVIVDLHIGMSHVIQSLAALITRRLLKNQTAAFTSGEAPPTIQVMLEEAHNLFATDRYNDDDDVWVRLAKEASKLNLGMTYATQEVSGVAHQVKANTANWVVAHLNNTREVQELARFYDFSTFSDSIISSEDKGFVRLKTLSSPFVVPVQIDRYDVELVNAARTAVGDSPLQP